MKLGIDLRRLVLPASLIAAALPAFLWGQASLTFDIWITGARSVVQGEPVTLGSRGSVLTGALKQLQGSLSGIPPNATLEYIWNVTRYDSPPNISFGDSLGMRIQTTDQTPLGTYPLTLTYTGTGTDGSTHTKSLTTDFVVRTMPDPIIPAAFPPDVDLPAVEQWEQNMLQFGQLHVDNDYVGCCTDFQGIWYYDGARAYLQMADYTGDAGFAAFARRIHDLYRDHVLNTFAPLFARFPHGLAMFHERDNDLPARDAVGKLQDTASPGLRLHWGASWKTAREQAYSVSSHVVAERLGFPRSSQFQDHVSLALGHFEQWFISETADFAYPFLVGLSAEALIDYWELTGDVRVPYLLKLAADWIWENEWDPVSESFWLIENQNGVIVRNPAPDLNLIVAPLYGWVFQQTGDVKYRDIGDQVFTSGVQRAWLNGAKQFTQNYRWSFKYVEWRKSPVPQVPQAPAPVTGLQLSVQ